MLPSFLLSLREGLEAALIIGIVLGALQKFGRPDLRPKVWAGALSAGALSLLLGVILTGLGASLEGRAEAIFEGVAMLSAAAVLTWMIFWMQRQASGIKRELETNVRQATLKAGGAGLFMLAFLAVMREGLELALFLTATAFSTSPMATLSGALLGLAGAFMLGWLLFAASVRLNLRAFFQVTGILLILVAGGLVAHGVHEFNEAGVIPPVIEHVWDINFLLPESSLGGQILAALFGYNGNPSLTEVAAYLLFFAALGFGLWRSKQQPAIEARQTSG